MQQDKQERQSTEPGVLRARFARSIGAKLVFTLALFLIVPGILYWRFQSADETHRAFVLDSIRHHGTAIAQALANDLGDAEPDIFPKIAQKLQLFESDGVRLRLLFNPETESGGDFFYVASAPAEPQIDGERQYLKESGLLGDIWSSCTGVAEVSRVAVAPDASHEVVVSVTPIKTSQGCWVLMTSLAADEPAALSLIGPYWQRPEVIVAAVIYLLMASVVIAILIDMRSGLRRFERLARTIADGSDKRASFVRMNRLPELDGVARQFDEMVGRLQKIAADVRESAEEQVHALKTPVGTIAQSLEALRSAVPKEDERAQRMLSIIAQSRQRLSALIAAGQQSTETTARLASPPREMIRVDTLIEGLCEDFRGPCEARGIHLELVVRQPAYLLGSEEIIETILENIVENAVGFSPEGGTIFVQLSQHKDSVTISVRDQGPGASLDIIDSLFDRGVTKRPASHAEDGNAHFGFGLWIVRRNVAALGGSIFARNVKPSGLELVIEIPGFVPA